MATVSPALQAATGRSSHNVVLWEAVATGDTVNGYQPVGQEGLAGTVHMFGAWGGATIVMQGSIDGSNWFTLVDVNGSAISLTADGYAEFSTAASYIRPSPSGGTGDDVDVHVSLRGNG